MFNLGRPANAKKAHQKTHTAPQRRKNQHLLNRVNPLWGVRGADWPLTDCANVSHREHDTVTFHCWNTAEWEIILAFTTKTDPLTIVGGGDVRLSSHGTWDRYSTVVLGLETAYDSRGGPRLFLASSCGPVDRYTLGSEKVWSSFKDASTTQPSVGRVYSATSLIIPKRP